MRCFWHKAYTPKPSSFFDTGTGDLWYWPLGAFLDGKPLHVSLLAVSNKPNAGVNDAFGFEIDSTRLTTIANPVDLAEKWHVSIEHLAESRFSPGASIVPDGDYFPLNTRVNGGEDKATWRCCAF